MEPIWTYIAAHPFTSTLIILMLLDVAMGLVLAFGDRRLNSATSWRGMTKKVGILLVVCLAAVIEPYANGFPLVDMSAGFYAVTEGISVLENAGRLGIPMFGPLKDALTKLRGESTQPITLRIENSPDASLATDSNRKDPGK